MRTVGIIPARLASSRLPRKLLLAETGRPLIQYAWEAACRANALDEVLVAADCEEIAAAVRRFGGRAELTGEHASGTDRVAEVVRRACPDAELIVNLQGDEPEMDPANIDRLVETLRRHPTAEMATLATPILDADELRAHSCVKVVCAADGRALYFSRSIIPHVRDAEPEAVLAALVEDGGGMMEDGGSGMEDRGAAVPPLGKGGQGGIAATGRTSNIEHRTTNAEQENPQPSTLNPQPSRHPVSASPWLLHLGIYAYRREFLLWLTRQPPSRLEQLEKLEQLRALEAGATIAVGVVEHRSVGIDTPADYARFSARCRCRAA